MLRLHRGTISWRAITGYSSRLCSLFNVKCVCRGVCACACVRDWTPTPKTPIWLQLGPPLSLLFYIQGNDCMSRQQDDWPFDWRQGQAEDAWLDAAATDGRTDSEVQTGDNPESNYASVSLSFALSRSLSLCLYFFSVSVSDPCQTFPLSISTIHHREQHHQWG